MRARGLLEIPKDQFNFLWVVDFPLFDIEEGKLIANHHPFTAPLPADVPLLDLDPGRVRGLHYDCVLNGSVCCDALPPSPPL